MSIQLLRHAMAEEASLFWKETTMEFKDWRKEHNSDEKTSEQEEMRKKPSKYQGKRYADIIDEQIREAEARGAFDNLEGFGKPLRLEQNVFAGDRSMGYNLLKSNGYAPTEVELVKEIRSERERAEVKLARLLHRSKTLRTRRIPPFVSEKRAFNVAVDNAALEYEQTLREINRKILTLNLIAPSTMHQTALPVEELVQAFRLTCPLFQGV